MTPPAKSAALRSASNGDLEPSDGVEQARARILPPRPVARSPARGEARRDDRLISFPSFEASRAPRKPVPAPAAPEAAPDLGAELEAALMNDLESMVALFDQAARDGNASDSRAAAPSDPDQEALERLLVSIRQGDGAPREAALPSDAAPIVAIPVAEPVAEVPPPQPQQQPRRPASPRPEGRERRLAPPSPRQRKAWQETADAAATAAAGQPSRDPATARPAAQRPPRAEPLPALTLPTERRSYLKPAIAASAVILLAAIGAGMTIRALTASNETTPTATAAAATATTAVAAAPAAPEASTPAPAAVPAPAATEPATTAEPSSSPVRLAADSSATASATVSPAAPLAEPAPTTETAPAPVAMAEPVASPEPAASAPIPMTAPAPEPAAEPQIAAAQPLPSDFQPATAAPDAGTAEAPVATASEAPAAAEPKVIASIPAGASSGGLQPGAATIASGVNLRSNPDNGAPVIGVLKTGTSVEIVGCKGWCEVVAGDKRGFVYQKFLSQS